MDSDTRRELKVRSGIDYILEHFRFQPFLFPRKIFTGIPASSQIINSKEEIFEHFKRSKFIDCWVIGDCISCALRMDLVGRGRSQFHFDQPNPYDFFPNAMSFLEYARHTYFLVYLLASSLYSIIFS